MRKPIVKLMLVLLAIASGYVNATELPNECSRDQNPNEFTILSYHEIAEKPKTLDATYAVSPQHFEQQIQWLQTHGYHFINVDDILAYRNKGKALPNKAVLITFDDGYHSVYANAYPILKKYKIPSVIALVGSWLLKEDKVDFAGKMIPRTEFLSQKEIKEMVGSGLVEIASHSYQAHEGIQGNPQGNMEPAITTRLWSTTTQKYEDDKSYQRRVYKDLRENNTFLQHYTGQKPRVMVWPYGHYNKASRNLAQRLGMPIGLTLDDGSNTKTTPLWGLRRILVEGTMSLSELDLNMKTRNANWTDDDRATKAAHVDLDYIYDANVTQQEKNLGDLLERIKTLGVNTIYLQAFSDPDSDGAADYVYFPNRHIPMRADLFNRVAWQIATRTQVTRIYAWIPLLAWELPKNHPVANDNSVITLQVDPTHLNMGYPRLSPFSPKARKVIQEIYADLAKSAYFDGILFHDDVTLSDYEDDSAAAHKQYKKWGLSGTVAKIRANRHQFDRWTQLKTTYLDDFALHLAHNVRDEQPGLKTARNLYAQVALNKNAQEWYAQNLSESIQKYDYTAIMAMPYMEKADDMDAFYTKIVHNVEKEKCGLERTVMELQSVNWRKNNEPIPAKEMNETINHLYRLGVHHIAYYPDNVFSNVPDATTIREAFKQKPLRMHVVTPTTPVDKQ
jgi:biofilm PGA synthesis lipoprotein PgaB